MLIIWIVFGAVFLFYLQNGSMAIIGRRIFPQSCPFQEKVLWKGKYASFPSGWRTESFSRSPC